MSINITQLLEKQYLQELRNGAFYFDMVDLLKEKFDEEVGLIYLFNEQGDEELKHAAKIKDVLEDEIFINDIKYKPSSLIDNEDIETIDIIESALHREEENTVRVKELFRKMLLNTDILPKKILNIVTWLLKEQIEEEKKFNSLLTYYRSGHDISRDKNTIYGVISLGSGSREISLRVCESIMCSKGIVASEEMCNLSFCAIKYSLYGIKPNSPDDCFKIPKLWEDKKVPHSITLNQKDVRSGKYKLKGCIVLFKGRGDFAYDLWDTSQSALKDSRFLVKGSDKTLTNLRNIKITVNILKNFETITDHLNWNKEKHGLFINFKKDGEEYSSTYLPSVISGLKEDKEEVIKKLIEKALSGRDINKANINNITVQRYEATEYSKYYDYLGRLVFSDDGEEKSVDLDGKTISITRIRHSKKGKSKFKIMVKGGKPYYREMVTMTEKTTPIDFENIRMVQDTMYRAKGKDIVALDYWKK